MAECFLKRTIIQGGGGAEEEYLQINVPVTDNLGIQYSGETLRLKLLSGGNSLRGNTVDGSLGSSPKSIIIDQGTGTNLIIEYSCFRNLGYTLVYDFSNFTFVPGMYANGFYNINPEAQIIVPASLYGTWVSTGYWVNYADQIVEG